MDAPNETRGETALMLDGIKFVLRPSWEAIQAFERATGKGVIQLAREAKDAALISIEVAMIASECIKAWGRQTKNAEAAGVKYEKVSQLINSETGGLLAAMQKVGAVLLHAATGGYTATGEVKPATGAGTMETPGAG